MSVHKLRPAFTFTEDRLEQVKQVVPEAFADGRINWDVLREALGEYLEDEDQAAERFGLFWPGKRQARRAAATLSQGTLVPCPGQGMNELTTRHIFIEGENLEVLKLLLKSYAGRVKMIYIDPPYNTGNDFVYPDDYSEPVEVYLRRTGQAGDAGEVLTTNTRAGGRYHSNWLNMVYPRLLLARQLLREDGVIFVSIDDNEVHNLRLIMNEVFGEENSVASIVWQKVYSPRMDAQSFSVDHDYVLAYSRSEHFIPEKLPFNQNRRQFTGVDEATGRNYRPRSLRKEGKGSRRADRPNLFYPLTAPDDSTVFPIRSDGSEGRWRWARAKYEAAARKGLIEWVKTEAGWQVYVKQFYDSAATRPPSTVWLHTEAGHNHEAVDELRTALGEPVFENPKPTRLVKRMLQIAMEAEEEELVLDFFAGSCSTAQALLDMNRADGGNRRFIMVQLAESTPEDSAARQAGFSSIAEIGKERIRRVIIKMQKEHEGKLDLEDREQPEDLGFKVCKLARSHFKPWHAYKGESLAEVKDLFSQHESPLVEKWNPRDLLVEVMLQEGFPLDSTVERQGAFTRNAVDRVTSEFCDHCLYACLDKTIAQLTVNALPQVLGAQDVFICLDSALTDASKMGLGDRCNLHVI